MTLETADCVDSVGLELGRIKGEDAEVLKEVAADPDIPAAYTS